MTLRDKKPRLRAAALVLSGTALLGLPACSGASAVGEPDGTVAVTASTNVWGSVAKAVGGDAVTVRSLIDSPTDDPHDYESSPSDGLAVGRAQLVVYNGGGYDTFFTDALAAAGAAPKRVEAYRVSGRAERAGHHGEHDHPHEGEAGHEHAKNNEHVFYDLDATGKVATRIAEQLGQIKPERRAEFAANARKFVDRLTPLHERAERLGGPDTTALATEPVADYLLETAGIENVTPAQFAEAVEHDIDVPAKALADSTALLTGRKVDVLVNNSQTETDTTNQLIATAERAGIPVVEVTETLPRGTRDYPAWIDRALDDLGSALGAGA